MQVRNNRTSRPSLSILARTDWTGMVTLSLRPDRTPAGSAAQRVERNDCLTFLPWRGTGRLNRSKYHQEGESKAPRQVVANAVVFVLRCDLCDERALPHIAQRLQGCERPTQPVTLRSCMRTCSAGIATVARGSQTAQAITNTYASGSECPGGIVKRDRMKSRLDS